jgi:hypothetical protein
MSVRVILTSVGDPDTKRRARPVVAARGCPANPGMPEPICSVDQEPAAIAEYLSDRKAAPLVPTLEATTLLIDRFESPSGLELQRNSRIEIYVLRGRIDARLREVVGKLG